MNKDTLNNLLKNLKDIDFKGNIWQILNSILLVVVFGYMIIDSKLIDESSYQEFYQEIDSLKQQNQQLISYITSDSASIKLEKFKELEQLLIDKTNDIEHELQQLTEEMSTEYDRILEFNNDQLIEFFAKYDTSYFFEPYIIVVE